MKLKIGQKMICKLDNKEYQISNIGTFRDKITLCNKENKFEIQYNLVNKLFKQGWSKWIKTNIKVLGLSIDVLYRYNVNAFEMTTMDDEYLVQAKVHPEDDFNFYKGLELVGLRMKEKIISECLYNTRNKIKTF